MAKFALDLARSIGRDRRNIFVLSSSNELSSEFEKTDADVRFVPVFASNREALAIWRSARLRAALRRTLEQSEIHTVVELMAHVWSPLMERMIRELGVRRVTFLHDCQAHPGDVSALATRWLADSALRADRTATLSRFVGAQIRGAYAKDLEGLLELFHPDFNFGVTEPIRMRGPLRILFLGRLESYKGLDLLIGAAERARSQGAAFELSIAGAGKIDRFMPRLAALDTRITNRWLSDAEIASELGSADVVAATHREASQSGVVASAFGAGRPVIVTPIGALPEQVRHGETGLVADRADAVSVADMILRLASDRDLLLRQSRSIRATAPTRSMKAFADALRTQLDLP